MWLIKIILSGIVGAFAGYWTNDWALKLMFNGVDLHIFGRHFYIDPLITKSKEKLGASLGGVVQDKLTNGSGDFENSPLCKRLTEPAFNAEIQKAIQDMLYKILPDMVQEMRFSELYDYNKSAYKLENLICNLITEHQDIINETLDGFEPDRFLTEPQQKIALEKLIDIASEEIKNSPLREKLIGLINNSCDLSIADILGDSEMCEISAELSSYLMSEITARVFSDNRQIKTLMESANVDGAIYEALSLIADEPVSKLLGSDAIETFVLKFKPPLQKLTQSKAFENAVLQISEQIFDALKSMDIPLYNILPFNEREKLGAFFYSKLAAFMPYLKEYLTQKRYEINTIIEDCVDEVINSETSYFLANTVRKLARDIIIKEIHNIDFIHTIELMADEVLQSENTAEGVQKLISDLLRNWTIARLAESFLTARKLCDWIISLCGTLVDDVPETAYQKIGALKPSVFLDERTLRTLSSKLGDLIRSKVPGMVLDEKNREKFVQHGNEILVREAHRVLHMKSGELLHGYKPKLEHVNVKAAHTIKQERMDLVRELQPRLNRWLKDKSLYGLIRDKIQSVTKKISQAASSVFRYGKEKLGGVKIADAARKLAKGSAAAKAAQFIQKKLVPKAAGYIDVKAFIKNKIMDMPNKWLGENMHDFIGRELRPLCYLGAALGFIIGLLLELCLPTTRAALSIDTIARLAAFAMIGVVTNWLAFFGLFRPYSPNCRLTKSGWLPGLSYIPKRIPQAADAFGEGVDRFLLDSETICDVFHSHKDGICEFIIQWLTENNCEQLCLVINEHRTEISKFLSGLIINKLHENDCLIAEKLCGIAEGASIGELINEDDYKKVIEKVIGLANTRQEDLAEVGLKLLGRVQISRVIPTDILRQKLRDGVGKYTAVLSEGNMEKLMQLAKNHEDDFQRITSKPLSECIPALDRRQTELAERFSNWATGQLFSEKTKEFLCAQADRVIQSEFDPDKKIENLMNGKLCDFLDDKLETLTSMGLAKIQKELAKAKPKLIKSVIDSLHEKINFLIRAAIDVDELAESVISKVIDEKLILFFNRETHNISERLHDFLQNEIYPIPISRIQLNIRKLDVKPLISQMLSGRALMTKTRGGIKALAEVTLNELKNQRTGTFVEAVHIYSLTDACKRFETPLSQLIQRLGICVRGERFTDGVADYAYEIIYGIIDKPAGELLACCPPEFTQSAALNLVKYVSNEPVTREFVREFMYRAYHNHASDSIMDFLDKAGLESAIKKACHNPVFSNEWAYKICETALEAVLDERFSFISPETQKQLADICASSVFETGDRHIIDMLKVIDVKDITRQVVGGMDGRGIHNMFNEFSKPCFRQLIAMGVTGVIFGIPGLTASLIYIGVSGILMAGNMLKNTRH